MKIKITDEFRNINFFGMFYEFPDVRKLSHIIGMGV